MAWCIPNICSTSHCSTEICRPSDYKSGILPREEIRRWRREEKPREEIRREEKPREEIRRWRRQENRREEIEERRFVGREERRSKRGDSSVEKKKRRENQITTLTQIDYPLPGFIAQSHQTTYHLTTTTKTS
ncbi:hypothetical protein F2Q69_00062485 [Brassica cretica]|uniref:Uncharacterized protein n=1 Tax=Brassica cretica TaxID=69181 RepID=A0A8S9RQI9_BRACR|nr:hypothetical protein F2Q69_00062485 [Brassica cretica]